MSTAVRTGDICTRAVHQGQTATLRDCDPGTLQLHLVDLPVTQGHTTTLTHCNTEALRH